MESVGAGFPGWEENFRLENVARLGWDLAVAPVSARGGYGWIKAGGGGSYEGVKVLGYGVVYGAAGDAQKVYGNRLEPRK